MTLNEQLDRIFAAHDRNDMQPTIEVLRLLEKVHPDEPRILYEVGGAYDTAGEEQAARAYYERALSAGLSGDLLRRCYLQYGLTLRNLGDHVRSVKVFSQARSACPDSPSLAVFEALSLHAAGRADEAVASLLEVVADGIASSDIDRYKPALRGNAQYIRSLGAEPSATAVANKRGIPMS